MPYIYTYVAHMHTVAHTKLLYDIILYSCVLWFLVNYVILFYSIQLLSIIYSFIYICIYIYIWHYMLAKHGKTRNIGTNEIPPGPNSVTGTALSAPLRAGSANDGKKRDEKVRWHHGILAQGPSDVTWNLYFGEVLSLGWLAKWYLNWLDFCWPRKSPMLWSFGAPTSIALTSHDAWNLPTLAMKNI